MDVRPALTQVVQSNSVPSTVNQRQSAFTGVSASAQSLVSQISQTPGLTPNQRSSLLNLTAVAETSTPDVSTRDATFAQIQTTVVVVANSTQSQTPPFSNLTGIRFFDGFRTQAVGAESLSSSQVQQLVQQGLQAVQQAPPQVSQPVQTAPTPQQTSVNPAVSVPLVAPTPVAPPPVAAPTENVVTPVAPVSVDIEV